MSNNQRDGDAAFDRPSVKSDAQAIIAGVGRRPTDAWFDALGRLVWLAAQEEGRRSSPPGSLPPGCYFDLNGAACIDVLDATWAPR